MNWDGHLGKAGLAGRLALVTAVLLLAAGAAMADQAGVRALEPSFGYWAPELREMHVHVPLDAEPVDGEQALNARGARVNGRPAPYAFWYVGGSVIAYGPRKGAGNKKIEVFVPLAWRVGEEYSITLNYTYAGKDGSLTVKAEAPAHGGVWAESNGPNYGFTVREEAGIARTAEPVEFDVTLPASDFPDPAADVRATVVRAPGELREIPCQVYAVESVEGFVRFRTAVQLSLPARGEALVMLWNCPERPRPADDSPLKLEGGALGGTVDNRHYTIGLDPKSGQLMEWRDKRLDVRFHYWETQGREPYEFGMNYTPDAYRKGSPWSHVSDWKAPETQTLAGPVFCETVRWGEMPGAPELSARATYRFWAGRPEVRFSSVLQVLKDVTVMAFRNGGMIQTPDLFTHTAWPRQDGSVISLELEQCLGNDSGSPPSARMPSDTPWVAFYNADKGYGLALVTARLSYFNTGPHHPNASNAMRYVSLYNHRFLYTIRAMNLTYCANIRTYPTPMRAGTVTYEEAALLPFAFEPGADDPFESVRALLRQMRNPLVVVP